MRRRLINLLKAIVASVIYAAILWYSISTVQNTDRLTIAMLGLISFGIAYSVWTALFKVAGEISGGIMVLAEFLNRHLLEPQKERLMEQVRQQVKAEAEAKIQARLAEVRARLKDRGPNPDDFLPPEEDSNSE